MAGLADAGQGAVGGAAQPDADPGGRPSTDVELDSFGLVVGRQTLVADSTVRFRPDWSPGPEAGTNGLVWMVPQPRQRVCAGAGLDAVLG